MEENTLLEPNLQSPERSQGDGTGAAPEAPRGGLAPHKLQKVLAYIDEKLGEPIGVRQLASQVHMSPFHFARRFKQAVGTPPHAYITHVRVDRAKRLLATTSLPLIEVATRVGYRTQAHFTGVFHRYVGTTPRAYRVNSRKELIPQVAVIPSHEPARATA